MKEVHMAVALVYIVCALLGALALYAVYAIASYKTGFYILTIENFFLWMWFWHRSIQKALKNLEDE